MAFPRCGALAVRIVLASYLVRGASTTTVMLPAPSWLPPRPPRQGFPVSQGPKAAPRNGARPPPRKSRQTDHQAATTHQSPAATHPAGPFIHLRPHRQRRRHHQTKRPGTASTSKAGPRRICFRAGPTGLARVVWHARLRRSGVEPGGRMSIWPGAPIRLALHGRRRALFCPLLGNRRRGGPLLVQCGRERTRIALTEIDGHVWHGFAPGVSPGQHYGYRVHGPWEPIAGRVCNPHKLLLDPTPGT